MPDNFLGNPTWAPNGFSSAEDQAAMQRAYSESIRMPGMYYAELAAGTLDRGDESYGGNSFQYIPTEVEIGAALAMRNMSEAGEFPVQENAPGMTQLLQSLYARTAQFWQDIRAASGTGW